MGYEVDATATPEAGYWLRVGDVHRACRDVEPKPRIYEGTKRLLDLGVAALLLASLAPFLLLVALAVRLHDGGPSLYWQLRVGRRGQVFACPKFRSMRVTAERELQSLVGFNHHAQGVVFKMPQDPRVTRLGRYLRRYSIDELPQLWCVLRGEMSLVGPRPPLVREVQRYEVAHLRRLAVAPGLTCLWQIQGRADLDFERQVELDLEYIQARCLGLDTGILLRTVPAVLGARGAY